MSKKAKKVHLTKEQMKELDKAMKSITEEAKSVVKDYVENPSEISGSTVHIHQDSPFVDENFREDTWKRVVRSSILEDMKQTSKNKQKNKKKA
tara:strand:+ start:184 stop:462 length:279 start_codon:yes stop_codon:yes gene_type:complete